MQSRDVSMGEATVNLPCKVTGGDIKIGFNPEFLLQAVSTIKDDELVLEMSTPNRPGLLKAGKFQYVLMPVNLAA